MRFAKARAKAKIPPNRILKMEARLTGNSRAGLFLFLGVYACLLAGLLPVLSLWLDELYDLFVARMDRLADVLAYVPRISGNVPLNYILQFWSVHLLGFSDWSGRLPSAIASVAACAGVFVLAKKLELRRPLLAAGIFSLFPLQLRYALEARPYGLALCISVWTTVAFMRVMEQPSATRAALYAACVTAGLYTFPYTLFVPLAHLLWAGWISYKTRQKLPFLASVMAVGIAVVVFAPWYLHSAALWRTTVASGQLTGHITGRAIPMILRELIGAGYIGSALTLAGSAYGLAKVRSRSLWLLCLIVPLAGAVAADAWFGYFLAIRQVIFVLTPLALLFTAGIEALPVRPAAILIAGLLAALVVGNISFFRRPRENWRAAASIISNESCVIFSPPDSQQLYALFVPELLHRECTPRTPTRVALAIASYASNEVSVEAERQLAKSGYVKRAEFNQVTPRVEIYVRP